MLNNITIKRNQLTVLILTVLLIALHWDFKEALAYSPPIGIPDPGFGIDEVRPSRPTTWTSEIAGYYYINQGIGTDSGRVYGTPTNPRKSIPSTVPAGSYVEVHGTYTSGGNIILKGIGNGAAWVANTSGPVWIVGANEQTRPVFTRKLVITGTYIYFDNIKCYAPGLFQVSSPTAGYPADHIVLRNSEIEGAVSAAQSAVSIGGASSSLATNVVIYNNSLHHTGNIVAVYDQDAHITVVENYSSNIWVLENTMHTGSGSGAQVGGASSGYENCHHVYYGKNRVYNTRQAGLAVKYASDVVFSQNMLHDIIDTRTLYTEAESASPGKGVGFQYAPNRVWILYNTIYNTSYGIFAGSTNGTPPDWYVYIIGNTIYNISPPSTGLMSGYVYNSEDSWAEAGIMLAGGTYRYIINNTIYNAPGGIYCPSSTPYYMENNIISNINTLNGYHIYMDSGTSASVSTLNNSIFYQNGGAEKIRWSSANVGNLSYIKTRTGKGQNSFNTDPKFVNTDTNDFHLQSGSPAIDSGIAHEVYTLFQSTYGIDIAKDINSIPRPQDAGWDIGAYEFSNQTTLPSPTIIHSIVK